MRPFGAVETFLGLDWGGAQTLNLKWVCFTA